MFFRQRQQLEILVNETETLDGLRVRYLPTYRDQKCICGRSPSRTNGMGGHFWPGAGFDTAGTELRNWHTVLLGRSPLQAG
jgi:hypothetical protein